MTAPAEVRAAVIAARANGEDYRAISKRLKVSIGSIALWARNATGCRVPREAARCDSAKARKRETLRQTMATKARRTTERLEIQRRAGIELTPGGDVVVAENILDRGVRGE